MSSSTREKLVGSMRDLAWSLWTELGASGPFRRHEDVLIDPEALILLTADMESMDPRLYGEALDVCVRSGELVSISRLQNLCRAGVGSDEGLSSFSRIVNDSSRLRWPAASPPDGATDTRAMSGKSQDPDLSRPALFRWRMRSIFGVGARADVLTELCYVPKASASELARIGYSKRQVAKTLEDLWRGGMVERVKEANVHRFRLTRPNELEALVGPAALVYVDWPACFRVLSALIELASQQDKSTKRMLDLGVTETFEAIADDLIRLGWGAPVTAGDRELWPEVSRWATERAAAVARAR